MLKFYVSLQNMLERLSRNEEGQTAVEYGLVVALISVVIVGVRSPLRRSATVIDNVVTHDHDRRLAAAGHAASRCRRVRPARRRSVSHGLRPLRSSRSTCIFAQSHPDSATTAVRPPSSSRSWCRC